MLDVVPKDEALRCQDECFEDATAGGKEVFSVCVLAVKQFMSDLPYKEFEESMYFHRFIQWKWLEG